MFFNSRQNLDAFKHLESLIANEIASSLKILNSGKSGNVSPEVQRVLTAIENSLIEIKKSIESVGKHSLSAIEELRSNSTDQASLQDLVASIEHEQDALDDQLESLSEQVGVLTKNAISSATEHELASEQTIFALMIASLVIGLLASWFIGQRLGKRIQITVTALEAVAEGDLTQPIIIDGNDEIGMLLQATATMKKKLLTILGGISDSTSMLSAASEELSVSIKQTRRNSDEQHAETEQIATAMHEMTVTVQEVASNINNTARAAENAKAESESGAKTVHSSIEKIETLARQINEASNVVADLSCDTKNINTVLDVIISISEQTNLLALNAAIEAARAGEMGRGFAVVADEVRTLAARTQQSTSEISHIIEKLQSGAKKAVDAISLSKDQAISVVEQSTQAGSSFTTIATAVSEICSMSIQIATAAEEQITVSEDMSKNVSSVNDKATENLETSKAAFQASESLAHMAVQLEELVRQFKIQ